MKKKAYYNSYPLNVLESQKISLVVASNLIFVKIHNSEANHSAKIHNISGSVLSQFNLNKETTEISLENLVQGIYFLTIENEKGVSITTKKIIKK